MIELTPSPWDSGSRIESTPSPWDSGSWIKNMHIIHLSYVDYYNHFKVTNVRIVRTLFPNVSPILKRRSQFLNKRRRHKNFTDTFNKIGLSLHSIPPRVSNCITYIQYLICKQKYITGDYTLT